MEEKQKKPKDDNVIFIGAKPFMTYVTSTIMQFNKSDIKEIVIKARGKFTSKAIDIAEVSTRRFLKDRNKKVTNVLIGSEEYTNREGKKANVSIIEITIGE